MEENKTVIGNKKYQKLADHLGLNLADIKEIDADLKEKLRKKLGHSISTSGILYTEDHLILMSGTRNNWNYYAGFEYIEADIEVLKDRDNDVSYNVFYRRDSDRSDEIIKLLNGEPLEEDEEDE